MSEAPRQFVTFLGVGTVAALANFGSRFVFALLVPFVLSVLMAFFIGLGTAFVLNRRWVFSKQRDTPVSVEAWRFFLVNLAGLLVTVIGAVFCLRMLSSWGFHGAPAEGVAHFTGLGLTAVSSFAAHKYWTFRG